MITEAELTQAQTEPLAPPPPPAVATLAPQDWPPVKPFRGVVGSAANPTPGISWRTGAQGAILGRVNASAYRAIAEIIQDPGTGLGLIVREGIGTDVGKFAIEPTTEYVRGTNVKLAKNGKATSPSYLCSLTGLKHILPPKGSSELRRDGNLFVASAEGWELSPRFTNVGLAVKRRKPRRQRANSTT